MAASSFQFQKRNKHNMSLKNKIVNRIKKSLLNFDFFRNSQTINGQKILRHGVNIEYSNFPIDAPPNLGDKLAPVVFEYLRGKFNLSNINVKKPIHLNMIGSIIAFKNYDAIIWGSGLLNDSIIKRNYKYKKIPKYDIRAVRGPLTRNCLISHGYSCPNVFGDPAILLPLIYVPSSTEKKYKISIIKHYTDKSIIPNDFHEINIVTEDYKFVIDEINASELVVSSSLHGLILAETYGIPTIWYKLENKGIFKFMDWYLSIGVDKPAMTIDLSNLGFNKNINLKSRIISLVEPLIDSFPFELWKTKK